MDSRVLPFKAIIDENAKRFGVPVDIIVSVILQESSGNPKAFASGENSRGLMQISEKLAYEEGLSLPEHVSLFEPSVNIYYGTKHLSDRYKVMKSYFSNGTSEKDKWAVVVSTYNQGTKYYQIALSNLSALGVPQTWDNTLRELLSLNLPAITRTHSQMYAPKVMSRVTDFTIPFSVVRTVNPTEPLGAMILFSSVLIAGLIVYKSGVLNAKISKLELMLIALGLVTSVLSAWVTYNKYKQSLIQDDAEEVDDETESSQEGDTNE